MESAAGAWLWPQASQEAEIIPGGIVRLAGLPPSAGPPRSAVRSQPAGQQIEEDGDGAGDEDRSDEAEPNDQRVNARVVGKAGGDTHDLGLAPVDQETTFHGLP